MLPINMFCVLQFKVLEGFSLASDHGSFRDSINVRSKPKYFKIGSSLDHVIFVLEANLLPLNVIKCRISVVSVLSCLHITAGLMNQILV